MSDRAGQSARVYLDHAATSFPKPQGVAEAMARSVLEGGASPGRGGYAEAVEAGRVALSAREAAARLLNAPGAERVAFTLSCTDALNMAIKGVVRRAGRGGGRTPVVVTTQNEHNSVLRPLRALEQAGECAVERLACCPATGRLDPEDLRAALRARGGAALVATHHASNVCGTIQPVKDVARVCREEGAPLLLDAAQTLGHVPLDVAALGAELVAFPGHKGLMGPLGTGGLYVARGFEGRMDPLREGGTGSRSELDVQPESMPERLECGSANAPGIAGLGVGIAWVLERGVGALRAHGLEVSRAFVEGLGGAPVRLLGPSDVEARAPVFAVVVEGWSAQEAAAALEAEFGLLTRAGLHCAPGVHRAMGTFPDGAVRVSFGAFSTVEDARLAARALAELARG
ncbi:MAG: aminotransferase class V-fold PLP-dependent enzyme [Phycisphaerales bacterium]|nr:aminotransferase class V-fold PLP-dependent enzyme [Phycisphaerales bacterium]